MTSTEVDVLLGASAYGCAGVAYVLWRVGSPFELLGKVLADEDGGVLDKLAPQFLRVVLSAMYVTLVFIWLPVAVVECCLWFVGKCALAALMLLSKFLDVEEGEKRDDDAS